MKFITWKQYFESNRQHFDHLDWNDGSRLTQQEKKLISSSIRQFQRGEHSEGKHFMAFAQSLQDPSYCETVKIFIREEQDHALVLGRFMDLEQIGRLKDDWLDNVFRRLRKLAGLEGTVTVLLTAEIISMIYYRALGFVTSSGLLKAICKQVLVDEEMHLRFQCYTLEIIYKRKSRPSLFFRGLTRSILMAGTIVMVWWFHRRVLRAGTYRFFSFFNAVWREFKHCNGMIRGKSANLRVQNNINHAA